MAADISKHLDRAKRFLEKNRVEDAIERIWRCSTEMPPTSGTTQALGDLYARMDQPDRAAVYYGLLFDLLVEPKDETKALAIYNRFCGWAVAAAARAHRAYAFLQQKQNHPDEAIEQYSKAAELLRGGEPRGRRAVCWERIAQLDPENLSRQLRLAEAPNASARQLLPRGVSAGRAACFGERRSSRRAPAFLGARYQLAPQERSVGLLYAQQTSRRQCRPCRSFAGTVCRVGE